MTIPWWRCTILNAGWDRWARVIPSRFGWHVYPMTRRAHWHGFHCFVVLGW